MYTMPHMTISLSKEKMKKLKELAESENRHYSNQIIHMMDFYIENKEKVKKS